MPRVAPRTGWESFATEWIGLFALSFAPYFFNVESAQHFEADKALGVRLLAIAALAVEAMRVARRPANLDGVRGTLLAAIRRGARRPMIVGVALLVGSLLLSSAFSVAPRFSWWGSYERRQDALTVLSYVTLFAVTAARLRRGNGRATRHGHVSDGSRGLPVCACASRRPRSKRLGDRRRRATAHVDVRQLRHPGGLRSRGHCVRGHEICGVPSRAGGDDHARSRLATRARAPGNACLPSRKRRALCAIDRVVRGAGALRVGHRSCLVGVGATRRAGRGGPTKIRERGPAARPRVGPAQRAGARRRTRHDERRLRGVAWVQILRGGVNSCDCVNFEKLSGRA